jgi:hypothetical protein
LAGKPRRYKGGADGGRGLSGRSVKLTRTHRGEVPPSGCAP